MVPVRPPPHPPVPATPNQQLHARSRSLAPTGDAENAVIHVQTARLDVRPLARLRFLVKYKGEFYLQSHVDCLGIRSEATLFGKGQMDSVGPVGGVRMPAHGSITTFDVHSQEVALLFTGRSRRIPTRERSVRLCQRFSEQVGYTGEFKPPASCKLRKMGTLRIFRLEFHPVLPPLYPAQMISQRSAQATEGISALKRKRGGTEDDSEGGTGMAGGGKASKKAKQIHDSPHPRRRQSTRIATAAKKKGGSASSVVVRRERRSLTIAELHAPSLVCVVALDASRKHVVVAALQV
ncbi:hypothetical protein K474DRAFT_1384150 [Panus rudis PR-1116 ss-1]|nr:hypothetical protein K474DRAFT_1384150 [Panus rudis PR-1116 ss-1]